LTAAAATQTGTATRPVALLVMGSGRSGTSALARILSLCGAALPPGMMGADPGNPLGYWEPRAAIRISEAILYRHGSAWFDPSLRLQLDGAFDVEEKAACIDEIGGFLSTLPAAAPLVLIKSLHINVLSDMWFEALRRAGYDIVVVLAVRHPQEVISSWAKLMHSSPELGGALWLKSNLLAERCTRDTPRVFVEYANVLEDWRREVKRISAALAIDLNARDERLVDAFLEPSLRRERHRGPLMEPFGTDWTTTVYEALSAAARDEPWDEGALDRVFEAYRATDHAFRTAYEDFHGRTHTVLYRLFRPPLWKLSHELRAMAHRRRGTWA